MCISKLSSESGIFSCIDFLTFLLYAFAWSQQTHCRIENKKIALFSIAFRIHFAKYFPPVLLGLWLAHMVCIQWRMCIRRNHVESQLLIRGKGDWIVVVTAFFTFVFLFLFLLKRKKSTSEHMEWNVIKLQLCAKEKWMNQQHAPWKSTEQMLTPATFIFFTLFKLSNWTKETNFLCSYVLNDAFHSHFIHVHLNGTTCTHLRGRSLKYFIFVNSLHNQFCSIQLKW